MIKMSREHCAFLCVYCPPLHGGLVQCPLLSLLILPCSPVLPPVSAHFPASSFYLSPPGLALCPPHTLTHTPPAGSPCVNGAPGAPSSQHPRWHPGPQGPSANDGGAVLPKVRFINPIPVVSFVTESESLSRLAARLPFRLVRTSGRLSLPRLLLYSPRVVPSVRENDEGGRAVILIAVVSNVKEV